MLISCRHYVSLATDAREGCLSSWNRARVAVHRAVCPHCRRFDAGMDQALTALHEDAPTAEAPSEAMESRLVEALRRRSR